MRHAARSFIVGCTLAITAAAASAAPGDVVVPAHRTKDGQWVPANVPPTSGRTYVARRPTRVASATKHPAASTQSAASTSSAVSTQETSSARSEQLLPPLLVEAQPIRH
jgi:hypothetical protein